jgi:hypothetical protein
MNTSPAVLRAQARIHRLSSGGFTDRTIGFFDGARRILVEAGGTGILLFLDILFGSMSLTMSFQNGASLLGIPIGASFIAVLISASTSAVQIVLWRIIVETTDWYKKVFGAIKLDCLLEVADGVSSTKHQYYVLVCLWSHRHHHWFQ